MILPLWAPVLYIRACLRRLACRRSLTHRLTARHGGRALLDLGLYRALWSRAGLTYPWLGRPWAWGLAHGLRWPLRPLLLRL